MTRSLLVLLLMLVAPAVLAQEEGTPKEEVETRIADFRKFYDNRNEHVRKAAVEDLGLCNHPDCVPLLLGALSDRSEEVRAAVGPALGKQTTKQAAHILTRELGKTRDAEVRLVILEALTATRPPVAYERVLDLASDRDFAVRLTASKLLGLYPSDKGKSEKVLLETLEESDPQLRLVALESLARLEHPGLAEVCLALARDDGDWRVQATAVESLVRLRVKDSIPTLFDLLDTAEGRLVDDVHRALIDLTGETYPAKSDRWRKWWSRLPPDWTVPTTAELAAKRKKLEESMAAYGAAADEGTPYHGIVTRSQRLLFVLDVSYSMRNKVVLESRSPKAMEEFKARYGDYETKIDLAREELINTVAKLQPHVKFNIVLFNSEVKPWKKSLVSASSGNRNAAIKFLSRLDVDWLDQVTKAGKGRTNTFGALNVALGLKDEPQRKPSKNHKVDSDTVFFMTDGMPEVGEITDTTALLEYFFEVNATAKIVFHVLTFGAGNRSFLEPLASTSNGRYVEIGN